MSPVVPAALWGTLAALPLLIGAWIALRRRPRERTVGLVAAFGSGALLSAVSYELVESAVTQAPPAVLAGALALGALTYYAGDRLLDRKSSSALLGATRGRAILLGATLDGIPESFILGLSIASGGALGVAFFVAVVVSNFPEGMASAAEMADEMSRERILLLWLAVVAASAFTAAAGAFTAGSTAASGALAQAFAAGALLTMLTDDLIPEARERGGLAAGLLGVLGFAVAFALHQQGI